MLIYILQIIDICPRVSIKLLPHIQNFSRYYERYKEKEEIVPIIAELELFSWENLSRISVKDGGKRNFLHKLTRRMQGRTEAGLTIPGTMC